MDNDEWLRKKFPVFFLLAMWLLYELIKRNLWVGDFPISLAVACACLCVLIFLSFCFYSFIDRLILMGVLLVDLLEPNNYIFFSLPEVRNG